MGNKSSTPSVLERQRLDKTASMPNYSEDSSVDEDDYFHEEEYDSFPLGATTLISAFASLNVSAPKAHVVFVIDISRSMKTQDVDVCRRGERLSQSRLAAVADCLEEFIQGQVCDLSCHACEQAYMGLKAVGPARKARDGSSLHLALGLGDMCNIHCHAYMTTRCIPCHAALAGLSSCSMGWSDQKVVCKWMHGA